METMTLVATRKALCAFVLVALGPPLLQLPGEEPVDYEAQIQPIFTASCEGAFCHIGLKTSGVDLSTYRSTIESVGDAYKGPIVVAMSAAGSPLWEKVASSSPAFGSQMPLGSDPLPQSAIDLIARWIDEGARAAASQLLRGDVDRSQELTINDSIFLLGFLFLGGPPPPCSPVANANGDERVDLSDAVYVLVHLFIGGPPPPELTAAEIEACSPSR